MKSTKISAASNQLTLDFEPGLVERFRNARDAVAQGVYQRGLKRVAMDLDQAPGNLSSQLADETQRHFSLDSFERYLETSGDLTPLYYLVEKFAGNKRDTTTAVVEQFRQLGPQFAELLKQMGISA